MYVSTRLARFGRTRRFTSASRKSGARFSRTRTRRPGERQGERPANLSAPAGPLGPAYEQARKPSAGRVIRIIEAIGEGVSLTAGATASGRLVAVLRPRCLGGKGASLAVAFLTAPYDFISIFATMPELSHGAGSNRTPATGLVGLNFRW